MGILTFSDGIEIDTSGELRLLELYDGWYIVGEGRLIPVKDEEVGEYHPLIIKKKRLIQKE
jgi:hypothetical protein